MNYINDFISYLELEDRSIQTIQSYSESIDKFDKWLNETFNIKDLKIVLMREINLYKEYLIIIYSPNSVNQKLSAIKCFYSFLTKRQIINDNPCKNIKLLKIEEHIENQYLTRSEEHMILTIAKELGPMVFSIILVLLKTGARVSEVSNLLLTDLYLEDNPGISIRSSKVEKSRYIPISKDVVVALSEWLEVRNKSDKIYHIRSNYVFLSQRSEKLSIRGIQLLLSRVGVKANVILYPIRFRASFANNLLQNKAISINVVATLMGHRNVNTTQRYTTKSIIEKRKYIEMVSKI